MLTALDLCSFYFFRFLFYTERSLNNAFIGKAYMDGSNNSVLINGSIGDPKGLAIDYKGMYIINLINN